MSKPPSRRISITLQPSRPSSVCSLPWRSMAWIFMTLSFLLQSYHAARSCSRRSPLELIRRINSPPSATAAHSRDTQFLLQVRRRGRVLEAQLFVRAADMEGRLGHQRRFVEAGQYQLQLAGIAVDVADGENAGGLAFEAGGVHRDQVFVQVDAELRDGPQLDGQAEEGQEDVGILLPFALVVAPQGHAGQLARLAMHRLDTGDMEFDFAVLLQLAHLIDTVLRGAKAVAVMHQGYALGQRRQVDHPVQGGISAAGDQDVLAAKGLHL